MWHGEILARLALLAVVVYGALLFGLAHVVQKAGLPARWFRTIHTLSLAVYCSSWTMFGGVGTAVSAGWSYVAIYVGPILVFLFAPRLLDRLMARARRSGSTSIADFISSCYGRSRGISAIVTIGALVASIPYVALQLRSVSSTFATLAGSHDRGMLGPLVAIVLAVFSISFGARHFSVAGRNDGLIAAIAAESLFKMLSFGALGLYAASLLFLHPAASVAVPPVAAPHAVPWTDIGTRIVLSAFAVICLPRQFYVGVSEARGDASLRSARWGFSAYLAIMVAAVVPLAIAGMRFLPAGADPDLFVLSLPLAQGNQGFALLAFLGGFSAATAMVITEAVALSTMVTNDLVAPLLLDGRRGGGEADLGRLMLTVRRVTILAIIGIALAYGATIGASRSLASIGLIALAGVAQFGPALVASLAFDLRHAAAARAGLVAGLAVWAWTLLLPSFSDGMLADAIAGATGAWLDPRAPFGLDLGSPIATGGLLALGANVAAMLLVRIAAGAPGGEADPSHGFNHVASLAEIEALVARFVGEAEAAECFRELRPAAAGDCDRVPISGQAARIAERSIARVIGAPSARLIVTSTMAGGMLDVGDVVRLLDQNEQNLQFSRTLLAATLEAIDPGVSVVDSNLRLIAWNPRYQEMFEYPAGLVAVGRPVADLIRSNAERGDCGPGEVDAHVERRLAHLRRGLAHSFERRRPNGRWIKTVGHAMPGGGYVMSFTDITAEKERQRELEERVAERTRDLAGMNAQLHAAKTAAETATRTKTQFLAAASHDLLQPLHAARLFCAALEREARPEQLALVRHVDGAIRSADLLLRSLLDVSKLDAGGVIPRPEPVDLAALIGALVAECAPVAAERRIGLCAHPGRFHIRSDPALLRSVVQNLLSNALYYTPAGGRVWIGARRRRGRIAIEVRDSGVGIPEADLGRIFGEFVRLDTGHARGGGGVGLGLAIVQRIALLLDLRIEVRSRPGAGSTFAVHLPETAEDMPPGAGLAIAPPAAAASGAMPHILCLDDDEHILAALAAALASRGCFAHPCRTPAEALAVADEAEPAAALLDLHLGGAEDGLDVARRLRALWPALPIAIVTADPVAARDSRFAGLDVALLAKPVEPERLWRFLGAVPGPEVSPAA